MPTTASQTPHSAIARQAVSAGSDAAAADRGPLIRPESIRLAWKSLRFPLLVASLLAVVQIAPGPHPFDDAYITYRYARNLAHGAGFVYNLGERVLGTTTPLYTLSLALIEWIASSDLLPWLSIGINALFDFGTALVLIRLLSALGAPATVSRLMAIAYILSPLRIRVALGGMETSMAVFWLVAASTLYVGRRKTTLVGALGALACLTRPDFVPLPALFFAYEAVRSRRIPWKPITAFAVVIAPWLLFSWLYFGNPLPQSIVAKSSAYFLHPYQAAIDLLAYLGTRSRSSLRTWPTIAIAGSAVVMLWLYVVGALRTIRQNRWALPLTLFAPVYALALALANPLLFIWYYPPLLLPLAVFSYLGVQKLVDAAAPRIQLAAMVVAVIGMLALEWAGQGGPQGWLATLRGREVLYQTAAAELKSSLKPGRTIGLPEIGVFGYIFSEHRVLDTVGLITPEAVPFLLTSPAPGQTFTYAISEEVIARLQPDYLVSLEIFVRPTLMRSDNFRSAYRLIREFDTAALDSDGLLVFERKGVD